MIKVFTALCIVFIAFLFKAYKEKKYKEIAIGAAYIASSMLALSGSPFISYVGLELLMLFATMLIFETDREKNIRAAIYYFLMHFFAGSLMFVGLSTLSSGGFESGSLQNLTDFLYIGHSDQLAAGMIFLACMILLALPPFQGWFLAAYSTASSTAICILLCGTTKIVSILAFKLFSGFHILMPLALLMICFNLYRMSREQNLRLIWIYGSAVQLGINLVMVAYGSATTQDLFYLHISAQIIYQALLMHIVTMMEERGLVELAATPGISQAKSNLFNVAYLIAIFFFLGMPPALTFTTKAVLYTPYITAFGGIASVALIFLTSYAIPIRSMFFTHLCTPNEIIRVLVLLVSLVVWTILYIDFTSFWNFSVLKYFVLFFCGVICRYFIQFSWQNYEFTGLKWLLEQENNYISFVKNRSTSLSLECSELANYAFLQTKRITKHQQGPIIIVGLLILAISIIILRS